MRVSFTQAMQELAEASPELCFLTGDLGFNALEGLQHTLGSRFINAGIAEQNMVSVAAGLAREGMKPWVYSIAPFCYARPFEQIRNDVCFHNLPVRFVGNGGGFGYGVQGPSHHAIEDCGAMASLQNMRAYAPAFDADLKPLLTLLSQAQHPAYIRLGLDEAPQGAPRPAYAPFRQLGDKVEGRGVVLALGGLGGMLWSALQNIPEPQRPNLWVCTELPLAEIPLELTAQIAKTPYLIVAEEHVATGGLGQAMAAALLAEGIPVAKFVSRAVTGYVSGRYGSQSFHRKENGIDAASLLTLLNSLNAKDTAA